MLDLRAPANESRSARDRFVAVLNAEEHKERQERGHEPALKVGSPLRRADGRGVGSRRKAVAINRWERRGIHRAFFDVARSLPSHPLPNLKEESWVGHM